MALAAEMPVKDVRWWTRLRLLLALVYVGLLVAAAATYRTEATEDDLYGDLSRGDVSEVVLGLDQSEPTVSWRTGVRVWEAFVVQDATRSGTGSADPYARLTAEVRERDPDVRVVRDEATFSARLGGIELPGWLGIPVLGFTLLGLALLVGGPQPWRATRWGWFWLAGGLPGGPLLLTLLSGPTPGVPAPHDPDRRISGPAGFALGVLLGSLLNLGLSQLLTAVWRPHP